MQGDVIIFYQDDSKALVFVNQGHLTGVQRFFSLSNIFKNCTDIETEDVYWKVEPESGISMFGCYETREGHRCILQDPSMKGYLSCLTVDKDFYAHCFQTTDLPHIEMDGCKLNTRGFHETQVTSVKDPSMIFNMRVFMNQSITLSEMAQVEKKFDCQPNSLREWIAKVEDHNLFWFQYEESNQQLDPENPKIDIEIDYLKDRPGFEARMLTIESLWGGVLLFQGVIRNGKITGTVEPEMIGHPAWKTRLVIGISFKEDFLIPAQNGFHWYNPPRERFQVSFQDLHFSWLAIS